MSFINAFSVSQPAVAKLGGTCPLWHLINENANKESFGFQKPWIFTVDAMHTAAGEKKSRTCLAICHSIIRSSGALRVCLLFFYCTICKHTCRYEMRNCWNGSANMDHVEGMRLKEVGHQRPSLVVTSFWGNISRWKGEIPLHYPAFLSQSGVGMKGSTNAPVRFQVVGRLRCSSGAQQVLGLLRQATVLGLLRAGRRSDCPACRNVKRGRRKIERNMYAFYVLNFVLTNRDESFNKKLKPLW